MRNFWQLHTLPILDESLKMRGIFMLDPKKEKWGFLRETEASAKKAGIDPDTGLHRTGLEKYLKVIYPNVNDWVHDKPIPGLQVKGKACRRRPDYRSEILKLIVEFDGLQHYTSPSVIKRDYEGNSIYKGAGYTVVRIPFFIQLSQDAVKKLFNVSVSQKLFNEKFCSMGIKGRNTPAYLCPAGLERMAHDFKNFPNQYNLNVEFLRKQNNPFETGVEFLVEAYNKLN